MRFKTELPRADPFREAVHLGLVDDFTGGDFRSNVAGQDPVARPVDAHHVEVDVIRDRDVQLRGVLRPRTGAPEPFFFTGPQAEHHGTAGFDLGEGFCGFEDHRRAGRIVVRAHARAVPWDVWAGRHDQRWSDVEVSTKDEPLVGGQGPVLVAADVDGPTGVGLEALYFGAEAVAFEHARKEGDSVLIGGHSVADPPVKVAYGAVVGVGWVGRFIGDHRQPVVDVTAVDPPFGLSLALVDAKGVVDVARQWNLGDDDLTGR